MSSHQPTNSESGADDMGVTEKSPEETEQVVQTNSDNVDELGKKMLKSMQDMTRQLEYVTSKCTTVESLFGSELVARRNKLIDLCVKTMFEAPRINGTTARDKLWRYAFYEPVSKAKRLKQREKWTPLERVFVKQHLLNGIGQLSLLMLKLQTTVAEFKNLKLRICPNGLDNILPASVVQKQNNEVADDQEWAIRLLVLFLLNIGDLCRYLTELYEKCDRETYLSFYDRAQDYYTQAFLLYPASGLAHNQLGTLSNKLNGGLDATFYFFSSLASKEPCESAISNLRRLLDAQLVSFARLSGAVDTKPVDIFSHNLLKILNLFLNESALLIKFPKLCEDTVGSFIVLLREAGSLDQGFLFRVISICMMTVWHLISLNSTAVSQAVCFTIGMFVHLMDTLYSILKKNSKLTEVIDMDVSFEKEELSEIHDDVEVIECMPNSTPPANEQSTTVEVVVQRDDGKDTFGKRRVLKSRGRRSDDYYAFIHEYDDSNDNMSESTDHQRDSASESAFSDSSEDSSSDEAEIEGDGLAESSDEEDDKTSGGPAVDSSEVSDISYQAEIEIDRKAAALKLSQSSDDVISGLNGKIKKLRFVLDPDSLQKCWTSLEPIMVATLPFIRWLQLSLPVQNALAASTEKEVMERFCQIFNMLESVNWSIALKEQWDKNPSFPGEEQDITKAKQVEGQLMSDWRAVVDGNIDGNPFPFELPEDLSMSGWMQFGPITSQLKKKCLTQNQMNVTRIGRLLVFGQWLVGTEAFAVIRSDKTFFVPSIQEYKRHRRRIQIEKFSRSLMPRKDTEFSGLNGTRNGRNGGKFIRRRRRTPVLDRAGGAHVNDEDKVYILMDLQAVLKNLQVIQKLSNHPKFIITFPYYVSFALDTLKDSDEDGSQVARRANRWLDQNSKRASYKNNIQLMKKEDKLRLDNVEYPSAHTQESCEFFDTLECCNYVRHQLKNKKQRPNGRFFNDARDSYRILYLTGYKTFLGSIADSAQQFNPIDTCRSAHVFLDRISRYRKRARNGKSFQNGHCGG